MNNFKLNFRITCVVEILGRSLRGKFEILSNLNKVNELELVILNPSNDILALVSFIGQGSIGYKDRIINILLGYFNLFDF